MASFCIHASAFLGAYCRVVAVTEIQIARRPSLVLAPSPLSCAATKCETADVALVYPQELVDCDTYDMGCNGGLMDTSFHWIQQNGGICSEEVCSLQPSNA